MKKLVELSQSEIETLLTGLALAHARALKNLERNRKSTKPGAVAGWVMEAAEISTLHNKLRELRDVKKAAS